MVGNNILHANVEASILTVYEGHFNSEGKEIAYFKAVLKATRGVREVSITEELFHELEELGSGLFTVALCFNVDTGKVRLDSAV